jgi:hypothetical protein
MFYCPTNRTFHRLFPNIGFKIITEPGSLEDLPCLERDKLSNRPAQYDGFRRDGNTYRQLSFGRRRDCDPVAAPLKSPHGKEPA